MPAPIEDILEEERKMRRLKLAQLCEEYRKSQENEEQEKALSKPGRIQMANGESREVARSAGYQKLNDYLLKLHSKRGA